MIFSVACADLDIPSIMEEAKMRWLRPNEIHAILCNYKYFNIFVKPVNLPTSNATLSMNPFYGLRLAMISFLFCAYECSIKGNGSVNKYYPALNSVIGVTCE